VNVFKSLLLIGAAVVLTGCKLVVHVTSGGDVQSASGTRNCAGADLCEFEITDTNFTDSFTATPREGYVFSRWHKGDGFFCAGSTNPTCALSNTGAAGNTGIEALIDSQEMFHIMPIFEFVGIDTDGDGIKDHLDEDDDNDGIFDIDDPYPLDPTRPGDDDTCGGEGQELVFETLDWAQQPGQTVIPIPREGAISSQFTTTTSTTNSGVIALVSTSGTGYVTRNMWISTCPGGAPVEQAYNGCISTGTEASVKWSQGTATRSRTTCMLQPSTVYYLNYSNEGCNASICGAFRNTYYAD
jgi:hypothetical protein